MASGYDALRAVLSDRTVAFHPQMARALGGINEALLFQQLAYWSGRGNDPDWIYKTQAELEEETALSEYQQHRARQALKRLGVIREERRGVPAKLYYQVVWEAVFELLDARFQDPRNQGSSGLESSSRETGNLDSGSPAGQTPGSSASNTESTPETTTKETDVSNVRKVPRSIVEKYDDVRLTLLPFVQDLARELNDQAPLASTTTRVVDAFRASGLDLDEFIDRLMQARAITQERTGSIRGRGDGFGPKPKMAYFLAVVEDIAGREVG